MRIFACCFFLIACLQACSPNNVTVDNNLKHFFDDNHVNGCFALWNNGTGEFTVYNLKRYRDSSFSPVSSFDIINSLVGLQTGVINNDSMVIKWDGVIRADSEWNKDLNMSQAFHSSAQNYFSEIAQKIGKDTLQHWLDSLAYGTKKIKTPVDSFWMDNSLKVKPDEQLGLIKKLYFDQLPFFKNNQEMIKMAMRREDDPNYQLSYKIGMGKNENGNLLVWVVGWIEENKHPYFFVLNFEAVNEDTNFKSLSVNMLKGILKQLGFMEGKM